MLYLAGKQTERLRSEFDAKWISFIFFYLLHTGPLSPPGFSGDNITCLCGQMRIVFHTACGLPSQTSHSKPSTYTVPADSHLSLSPTQRRRSGMSLCRSLPYFQRCKSLLTVYLIHSQILNVSSDPLLSKPWTKSSSITMTTVYCSKLENVNFFNIAFVITVCAWNILTSVCRI